VLLAAFLLVAALALYGLFRREVAR
jgi:hypothetical protein